MKRRILSLVLVFLCSASQALAADPILVGGLFSESGKEASVGTASRLVAEMTIKAINDAGGVLGRPIKMIAYDSESDPNVALRMARQLAEKDQVLAIIGPTATGSGMAVKQYTEEKGLLSIMTVGGDVVIAGDKYGPYKWTFKTPQRSSVAVTKIFEYLRGKGVNKIALLASKDGFGQDGRRHLQELSAKFGLSVVAEESLDPQDSDFSAQAFKLALAKPQAVIVWTIGPSGAIAAKNFAALPGEKPLVVQCHGQPDPKFIELAGKAAEGALMPGTKLMGAEYLADSDPQKPVLRSFIEAYTSQGYEKKFPLNTHSGYAYDAMTLFTEALKKAGKAEGPALRDALEQLKGVVGVSGIFNLSPEDHNGLQTDSLIMLEVRDGQFKPAP